LCLAARTRPRKQSLRSSGRRPSLKEQNKAIVTRAWEAWSKGDYEAIKEVVAPEYVWYAPSGSTEPRSLEETIESIDRLRRGFPDVTFSIEEIIAVENRVIVRYTERGTHQGEWLGIPATGNKIEMSGIMIHHIENGKIVEDREEFDMLGFMQQLGMELKPKEVKK